MGSIADYLENKIINHVTGVAAYTPPSIYVGTSTADPLDDASGMAEPSGNNYARVAVSAWNAGTSRMTTNTNIATFPQCQTAPWGTQSHWFLCDHATNVTWGTNVNLLAHGSFAVAKQVVVGNTPSIAAGEMDVTWSASVTAGGWCDLLVHEMLDHVFGTGSYTAPSLYLAYSTTTPTDAGGNVTEPSGNNYARKLHAAWDTSTVGATENTGAITQNVPSGSWGTLTHALLGNHITNTGVTVWLLWIDVADQLVGSGDTVEIPDGGFDITLA